MELSEVILGMSKTLGQLKEEVEDAEAIIALLDRDGEEVPDDFRRQVEDARKLLNDSLSQG